MSDNSESESSIELDLDLDARIRSLRPLPSKLPRSAPVLLIVSDDDDVEEADDKPEKPGVSARTNSDDDDDNRPIILNGVVLYDPSDESIKPVDEQVGRQQWERQVLANQRAVAKGDFFSQVYNTLGTVEQAIERAKNTRRNLELIAATQTLKSDGRQNKNKNNTRV